MKLCVQRVRERERERENPTASQLPYQNCYTRFFFLSQMLAIMLGGGGGGKGRERTEYTRREGRNGGAHAHEEGEIEYSNVSHTARERKEERESQRSICCRKERESALYSSGGGDGGAARTDPRASIAGKIEQIC